MVAAVVKRRTASGILLLVVLFSPALGVAQTSTLRTATLIARLMAYDRALASRAGKSLTIAIVHSRKNASEGNEHFAAFSRLKTFSIQGLRLQSIKIAYVGEKELAAQIKAHGVDVLFVCSGLSHAVPAISRTAKKGRALTTYADPSYTKKGLAVGVVTQNGKSRVIIHLSNAKAQGALLASSLLRIATVIGR